MRPYILLISVFLIFSCKKTDTISKPGGGTTPITGTIKIALAVDSGAELIVSEAGGNILLDSVFAAKTRLTDTLHTNATLVDVTTVDAEYIPQLIYFVRTYKAVDPTGWDYTLPVNPGLPPVVTQAGTPSTITYSVTVPPVLGSPSDVHHDSSVYFLPAGGGSSSMSYGGSSPTTITANYNRYNNYPVYLLFGSDGRYSLYTPPSGGASLQLTSMDTAQRVRFTIDGDFTPTSVEQLYALAFMDTTDLANSFSLFPFAEWPDALLTQGLWVPKVPAIQKYQLSMTLFGNTNMVDYYNCGDSIPSVLVIPDASYYTLTSTQTSGFTVGFPKTKPSDYITTWTAGPVSLNITAPADSTTLYPLQLLSTLHSKLLKGQDFSSLRFSNFDFILAPGYGYQEYMQYVRNSASSQSKRMGQAVAFSQGY